MDQELVRYKYINEDNELLKKYIAFYITYLSVYKQKEDIFSAKIFIEIEDIIFLANKKDNIDFLKEYILENLVNYINNKSLNNIYITYYVMGAFTNKQYIKKTMELVFLSELYKDTNPELSKDLEQYIELITSNTILDKGETWEHLASVYERALENLHKRYNSKDLQELIKTYDQGNAITNLNDYNKIEELEFLSDSIKTFVSDAVITQHAINVIDLTIKDAFRNHNEELKITKDLEDAIEDLLQITIKDNGKKDATTSILSSIGVSHRILTKEGENALKETISKTRDHAIINEVEVNKEWIKVNSSKHNRDILGARDKLATYRENNIEELVKTLQNLTKKYNGKKDPELAEEIKITEEEIERARKLSKDLEEEITTKEENLKALQKQYKEARDLTEDEKTNYIKLLKKQEKELSNLKSKRDNRGLYIQLDIEDNLTINNNSMMLSIPQANFDINKYNREGQRALIYIQDKLYYNPDAEEIIIDLEEYAEETGRNPSSYKAIRKNLEDAFKVMIKETYTVKKIDPLIDLEEGHNLNLLQYYGYKKYKGKTTYKVELTTKYKKILLNEKALQWASIPRLLNKLKTSDTNERVRELGFYFYYQLRINLDNKEHGNFCKKFIMKTLIEVLESKGLIDTTKRYARSVIEPMESTLNGLEDLGLIEYKTNAFRDYSGDKEKDIKGTLGTTEEKIRSVFEDEDIIITFKVADTETYDKIINNKRNKRRKKKKSIATQ